MEKVGFTTTIPVEVILSGGYQPVDLNNLFITSRERESFVQIARFAGYPRNICEWIKGLFGAVVSSGDIKKVVAVTRGDCSNTQALMETLEARGIDIIPFEFPYNRTPRILREHMIEFADTLGTTLDAAEKKREELLPIRRKLWELDRLTYEEYRVSGRENHLWLVSSSDFNGDPERFFSEISEFLLDVKQRDPIYKRLVPLGYIGVPPIFDDLYDVIEQYGGTVIFNEIQRQFAFPYEVSDIVEQYLRYTYPYSIFFRLDDIKKEIKRRGIRGVIHYVQSFCFRQIEDIIIRGALDVPVLTVEGGESFRVDERTKIRIQAFIKMLR
ncbi:2-hydroxyacyl-CoA dehydratase [bacterium]|nr:2-hydroxyacyl-CoA dehydratase [bacterium]